MKSKLILKNLFFCALSLCALPIMAQFPPPPAPSVPIDGGLLTVVGAGVAYGIAQHRKNKRKK